MKTSETRAEIPSRLIVQGKTGSEGHDLTEASKQFHQGFYFMIDLPRDYRVKFVNLKAGKLNSGESFCFLGIEQPSENLSRSKNVLFFFFFCITAEFNLLHDLSFF